MHIIKGISRSCLLLLLLAFLTPVRASGIRNVGVEKGVLDLRNLEKGTGFMMRMNGEWEFYYNRFLIPEDSSETRVPDCYSRVPSYWTQNSVSKQNYKGTGYGTYRCIVLLPSGYNDVIGFDVPIFDTSYEMFVNGALVSKSGKPGKNKSEATPNYNPAFVKYVPYSDTLDIIIKVSNFELRHGGFSIPMKIGSYREIHTAYTNLWIKSVVTASMLLMAFLFSIVFFLHYHNRKILAFSILTLTMAIRPLVSSPFLITLLNNPGWVFTTKASYFNVFLMILSGASFVHYVYPTQFSKIIRAASAWVFVIMTLIILFSPLLYISYSDPLATTLSVTIVGYALYMSFRGVLKKRWADCVYFAAILIMAYGSVSDILFAYGKLQNQQAYIVSFTMLLFTFIQASLLIREWVNTYKEKEKLNYQLEDLTKHLEERVFNRTRELNSKTAEIENQHKLIVEQNARLSDTIRIKNKIFSVISHDLRGPMVNIQYVLNLIKEDEFSDQTEPLTNSCIKYSQMVISLLENMLVWGRGQEEMIHYSPSEYDLADTILTNLSIYKESADQKEISLNFTHRGKSKGWFDKDLIDIIIRNLISNAIKFTNRGGRVSIVLNESDNPVDGLILKICDNGIGMPPEQLKDIFSCEDVQSTSGTENEKGTGLGLKLVYELVTLSHGTITVESTPGIGSGFTITLPGKNNINIAPVSKVPELSS